MVAWFDLESIAKPLQAAARAGANVRVLVRTTAGCVWLVSLGLSARRLTTIHRKVAVFRDYVLTRSANWTRTSLNSDWNDIVIIYDPTTRDAYWDLFNRAWDRVTGCGN